MGETEIMKGEGMDLGQLLATSVEARPIIKQFDLEYLRDAFDFRETGPVDLPTVRKSKLFNFNLSLSRKRPDMLWAGGEGNPNY